MNRRKKKNKMAEKLVLDENVICQAIELKNKDRKPDKTSAKCVSLIYETCHKIVCDKFLWKRYKDRIRDKRKIGDPEIIELIEIGILRNSRKCIRTRKDAKPLPAPIERDFETTLGNSNEEDIMFARVAAENRVYALITDDARFHDWINDVLQSRYDFSGLTPAEALEDAGLELSQN